MGMRVIAGVGAAHGHDGLEFPAARVRRNLQHVIPPHDRACRPSRSTTAGEPTGLSLKMIEIFIDQNALEISRSPGIDTRMADARTARS